MEEKNIKSDGGACKIILGILFFIIIAGSFIQCTHKAGQITDIIIDNPY